MDKIKLSMEKTEQWTIEIRNKNEAQANSDAKKRAQEIQAEAKARARVASETAHLQANGMAKVEAALVMVRAHVGELR